MWKYISSHSFETRKRRERKKLIGKIETNRNSIEIVHLKWYYFDPLHESFIMISIFGIFDIVIIRLLPCLFIFKFLYPSNTGYRGDFCSFSAHRSDFRYLEQVINAYFFLFWCAFFFSLLFHIYHRYVKLMLVLI